MLNLNKEQIKIITDSVKNVKFNVEDILTKEEIKELYELKKSLNKNKKLIVYK